MARHLFTSMIKCEICGYRYRFIWDRAIPKYICGGYSKGHEDGCKTRHSIEEDLLVGVIKEYCITKHIVFKKNNAFIKSIVDKIIINIDDCVIHYKAGHTSCISPNIIRI